MPWVSIREAAEMLHLSTRTIERMCERGTLPSRLEHGRRLVFVSTGDHPSAPPAPPATSDPAVLACLFDLDEALLALFAESARDLAGHRAFGPVFEAMGLHDDHPTAPDCERLHRHITVAYRQVAAMVQDMRIDRRVLSGVYQSMLHVQLIRRSYAERLAADDLIDDGSAPPRAPADAGPDRLTTIIQHLRTLLIATTPQDPGAESR